MRHNLLGMSAVALVATSGALTVIADTIESPKVETAEPPPAPKPHPLGRMTIEEAMQRTGTTSPKAALAKLNEGRVGRKHYSYMPHTGDRARARYKRQLEKERAREAAKVQAAE